MNATPRVGSIAWRRSGHVGVVVEVGNGYITVASSSFKTTQWPRGASDVSRRTPSGYYFDGFIHVEGDLRGPWDFATSESDIPIAGNWDGHGGDDVGVVRGNNFFLRISGAVTKRLAFGNGLAGGDVPIAGDWNGDGKTDIGVVRGNVFIEGMRPPGGTYVSTSVSRSATRW